MPTGIRLGKTNFASIGINRVISPSDLGSNGAFDSIGLGFYTRMAEFDIISQNLLKR